MTKTKLIAMTAGLLAGSAFASDAKLSAQSIIVNPVAPALGVQVWTDRDASGTGNPIYRPGERIRVGVETTQDAYVYLFNLNADGKVDLFLPNGYQQNNFVKANTKLVFPASGAQFQLNVSGPAGQDKLLALASKDKLNLDQLASFVSGGAFGQVKVSGQQELAQALSIVVNPLPAQNWTTDTALFRVAGFVPTPADPVTRIGVGEQRSGAVDSAMRAAYERLSGPQTLGQPGSYAERWGNGWKQNFAGAGDAGAGILTRADGSSRAYAVRGPILERYLDMAQRENGGTKPPARLGWAAGDEKVKVANIYGTRGAYGYFQNGALYFSSKHGTSWLSGAILNKYQALGGAGSALGFPTRDQYLLNGSWAADFEGGSIRMVNGVATVQRR